MSVGQGEGVGGIGWGMCVGGWWGLHGGGLERVMEGGFGERALVGKGLWLGRESEREIHIDWVLIWWRALFNPCTKPRPSPLHPNPRPSPLTQPPPSPLPVPMRMRSWRSRGGLRGWSEPADRSKLNSAGLLFVFTLCVCVCVSAEQNNPYIASHVPAPFKGFFFCKNTINQGLLSQVAWAHHSLCSPSAPRSLPQNVALHLSVILLFWMIMPRWPAYLPLVPVVAVKGWCWKSTKQIKGI